MSCRSFVLSPSQMQNGSGCSLPSGKQFRSEKISKSTYCRHLMSVRSMIRVVGSAASIGMLVDTVTN